MKDKGRILFTAWYTKEATWNVFKSLKVHVNVDLNKGAEWTFLVNDDATIWLCLFAMNNRTNDEKKMQNTKYNNNTKETKYTKCL